MIPNPISASLKLADGREITIETGKMARQADGSVVVRMGDCMILATVVATKEPKPGQIRFRRPYSRLILQARSTP